MPTDQQILTAAYQAFNARDIASVLALMHPQVDWPNGMEGGRVHGHEEVRAYWTRQWSMLDPHVEPLGFQLDGTGRTVVDVHQTVRDLTGNILQDRRLQHIYRIEQDLILSMEINQD
ncbi:MAG: nuclear transport factor 2 family protein [Acidobacteria bacterium]|nr:nuclear transport factor 2 family protein [Acidobacteriota bacterium]